MQTHAKDGPYITSYCDCKKHTMQHVSRRYSQQCRRVFYLPFAIKDAVNEASDRIRINVTLIRLVLKHVITEVYIAIRRTLLGFQAKELQHTQVI